MLGSACWVLTFAFSGGFGSRVHTEHSVVGVWMAQGSRKKIHARKNRTRGKAMAEWERDYGVRELLLHVSARSGQVGAVQLALRLGQ